ncbi:bifunctional UDP-N-acetylmuramoyl-L-alanyl-D-glutamate--2,6-diaminopimelate ligase MurE/UDP-N-acetylmuramoyl-tripeptide--D-alanyl-D-alanine ligase MurF [Castellaniella caeni]|uniref:bifunctional UDP-N-acetylmuramoyl-L-alanyl-D-glutamate--2, 6-diaminopimelate ligase MurE/UDP-N-acetylmuramoyl-tripeptide--D-alanyl-D-alanine ligase MurF n=1 Tax=Castellaniella caeni TaxID=266123 RepID=UPI000C9FDF2A|nr:bifunctional UDP-N-acetylmuramoyl-L-alanyl-D-glutamate--2,6-diaminopimelate ligase MurE/UDP-N-acetylmuramoyl-tripeptide--D-alanyl-D-alanine ligase MurF [Castellaniella caeni]
MNTIDILAWLDERVARQADLCLDSRQIQPGDVFFACPGIATDGRSYMQAAVAAGAAAIVCEADGAAQATSPVPVLPVARLATLLGDIAHLWYGRPSDALAVIAVTGTNGKTSTTQWVADALNAEGTPCGTVGTLGVKLADGRNLGGALTTPDVLTLHRSLAAIVRAGGLAAAIEASSIGIEQGRLDGVHIQVAGFTNLTRDHLDYHGTLERYKQAKFALFVRPGLRSAVINADDAAGAELLAGTAPSGHRLGYSLRGDTAVAFRAEDVQHGADGLVFKLVTPSGSAQIFTHLVGEHNISNLLLVAGVLRELGWGLSRIARALAVLRPVPGRLQVVSAVKGEGAARPLPLVVVDYAHTPDALERVLTALRPVAQERGGRLTCVFGCGGDRDVGKRPLMGAVAARLADEAIVTTDNPRTEAPQAIIDAIVAGMPTRPRVEADRAAAILDAIWRADERDVVLLAGKGHETYQEVQHVRSPFDDREWARFALSWRQAPVLSTDSRKLPPGALFLALRGERFDGHDYLDAAAQAGARAAIVAHPVLPCALPQIVLGDTHAALIHAATVWRRLFDVPVIAVTGSNGKTTTKEMISAILAAWWGEDARLATRGNFNNDIGLPLTVLRLGRAHRAAVLELGMNHPGEIPVLAAIAQPTVALVNNAQREHQEFMNSVEAVAHENGAILQALPGDGVAVFPADEPYTGLWQTLAGSRAVRRFGFAETADVHAAQIRAGSGQTEFRLHLGRDAQTLTLHAPGRHNLRNALAAAASAWAAGASLGVIVRGLEAFRPVGGRMQPETLPDGFQLINDTYNANPDSVRAAIDVLAGLDGRRILVLGDMGEVGDQGPAMHAEVGAYARQCGIDLLLTLGAASAQAARAFGASAQAFETLDALLPVLLAARPGHILVKGSRSMRMERVVDALHANGACGEDDHAA